ncbi:transposase [Oleiphilus messinensis]|uniref:Transposase n=1 Tax=Oleiphilus messinensis TaxID=141451 RepID=A0A1Y0IEB5_9GAMM|nr:transposase [Oleiphilus messinensis]ARU58126.1 transposase [Oleiphilus messinensis]
MTVPRDRLVSLADTPYYHIVSRCVRRTFLCGTDHQTGQSFEHRRQWIEDRIRLLSSLFTVDICAYAVMSNHYHLVIKLNPDEALDWSQDDVLARWCSVFKGPLIVRKYLRGDRLDTAEKNTLGTLVKLYRKRLTDLSWFMKCLNEPIARMANREDDCTGHFWEGRFRSQALLTKEALLSCMAYVDLNPVRANMADTPEEADHTSLKERARPAFDPAKAIQNQISEGALFSFNLSIKPLLHFEETIKGSVQVGLPFTWQDYLHLVDYTGRAVHPSKRGSTPEHLPSILCRLGLSNHDWLTRSTQFEAIYERQYSRRKLKSIAA